VIDQTTEWLDPTSPERALEFSLEDKAGECRQATVDAHRSWVGFLLLRGLVGGLLDEPVEDFVNDVFEVSREAIDRVPRRWSTEATTQPDNYIPKLPLNRTNTVDVVVVAMEEATHQL
jgi:hypothetical protein